MPDFDTSLIIGVVVGVILLVVLLVAIGVIIRAGTRTALIGMVDQTESTEAVTVKEGWKIGWSRRAFTMFVINMKGRLCRILQVDG